MLSVRRLRIGEGLLYKKIRLTSLQDAPFAFTTTYASALSRSPESWSEQADHSAGGPDRATFIAFSGETPVGLAALYRDKEGADTGEVLQVWVSPEQRGKGVAAAIMDALLRWAGENGFHRVRAGINPGNIRAVRFYQKYGFRFVSGHAPNDAETACIMEMDVGSTRV